MLQFGGQRGGRHGGEQGGRHDGRHVGEQVGRHVMLQFDEKVGHGGRLNGPKLCRRKAYPAFASSKLCKFISFLKRRISNTVQS